MRPIVVISLGAGVQSSTLYLMAARGLFRSQPHLAIFADTQDEGPHVYRQLEALEKEGGGVIPIVRATAGRLSDEVIRSIRETPSQFVPIPTYVPGPDRERQGRRQCTRSHKTDVVAREIRKRLHKGQTAQLWIGISTDESHRARPSRYPRIENVWPLLFERPMRRGDCIEWLASNSSLRTFEKSSCVYCPFHSDRDWLEMKERRPKDFQNAVEFEDRMRRLKPNNYLHDSCVPLRDVAFSRMRDQPDLFGNECEGMCGV